jgi:hypothetical protein
MARRKAQADSVRHKKQISRATLPVVRPIGNGHMPLSAAAYWIATKGGGTKIKPNNDRAWRVALEEILAQIEANKLEIIGERDGKRGSFDVVPTGAFEGIWSEMPTERDANTSAPRKKFLATQVSLPWSSGSDALSAHGKYLECRPFIDDQHWQHNFHDKLYLSGRILWARLKVKKPDVARFWPFDTLATPAPVEAPPALVKAPSAPLDGSLRPGGRKRGPKAIKSDQVKRAMLDDIQHGRRTKEQLDNMLEKEMVTRYAVSRDTARKARRSILEEFYSRQIATNDK